ncbi:MAG: hypothetical protein ACSHXD_17135 [Marinosulfonomonas sp.]
MTHEQTGWRPMPLALKVLFCVMLLWSLGSVMNLPNLMANGLPLFGVFVSGIAAFLVVLLLDLIGPLGFLIGMWTRKPWAPSWAFTYIGVFVLNALVALVTVREQLGLVQILIPMSASLIFAAVIYWKLDYFSLPGKREI